MTRTSLLVCVLSCFVCSGMVSPGCFYVCGGVGSGQTYDRLCTHMRAHMCTVDQCLARSSCCVAKPGWLGQQPGAGRSCCSEHACCSRPGLMGIQPLLNCGPGCGGARVQGFYSCRRSASQGGRQTVMFATSTWRSPGLIKTGKLLTPPASDLRLVALLGFSIFAAV